MPSYGKKHCLSDMIQIGEKRQVYYHYTLNQDNERYERR